LCDSGNVSQFVLQNENGILEKLPILMRKRSVNNGWDIRRCLLCGADAYALRLNIGGGQVLVNTKLLIRDNAIIDELRKSAEISPVFQVILPKKDKIPSSVDANVNAAGNANGFYNGAPTTMLSRGVLQSVQTCISQYLTREQEAMEDRIRRYIDEQQNAFERLKAEVKMQKATLLRFVVHNGGGVGYDSMNGGTFDDDFDGALPLSPLSMTSGDPSPGLNGTVVANGLVGGGDVAYSHASGTFRMGNEAMPNAPLRPKALSNPASLTGWKRKRHSGGNGMTPGLASHAEEQQDIFTFDEQDTAVVGEGANQAYLLGDDEGNITDDSGTGEDYNKYYPPPPPPPPSAAKFGLNYPADESGFSNQYGASLPVRVPMASAHKPMTKVIAKRDEIIQEQDAGEKPKDVGASMHALALSMQGADDPERLFGERPQRRRWKTGEDQQQIMRQRHYSTATGAFIKEKQNY